MPEIVQVWNYIWEVRKHTLITKLVWHQTIVLLLVSSF